jgi:uncharacterized membrane protein YgdD (TMEM256/DUF423 family)
MESQYKVVFGRYLLIASGLLFLAVALGAFGAHGLEKVFNEKQIANWHTANNYMVMHAFALFVVAVLMQVLPKQAKIWQRAGLAFLLGITLFSGSLFLWSITLYTPLVFFTPIGGTFFLIGWAVMFWGSWKVKNDTTPGDF